MKRYRFTYNNYLAKDGKIEVMADSQDEAFRLAYDDLIDTWAKGELKPLLYLASPDEKSNRLRKKITLSK